MERVRPCPAVQQIIAIVSPQCVKAGPALQRVVARPAHQLVPEAEASDMVVARPADEPIVHVVAAVQNQADGSRQSEVGRRDKGMVRIREGDRPASPFDDDISARIPNPDVGARGHARQGDFVQTILEIRYCIAAVARGECEHIPAAAARQAVVARAAVQRVPSIAARQRVVAAHCDDRIVAICAGMALSCIRAGYCPAYCKSEIHSRKAGMVDAADRDRPA